jgi:hypothetical protein
MILDEGFMPIFDVMDEFGGSWFLYIEIFAGLGNRVNLHQ